MNQPTKKSLRSELFGMSKPEKATLVLVYGSIIAVSATAFVAFTYLGTVYKVFAGLGALAYVFGLRHGFDADHIAAIDNVTRKLMQQGKRPLTVGTWFSIGHSVVVAGMCIAIALFTKSVVGQVSSLTTSASTGGLGIFSTFFSGAFLFILGGINVVIVLDIYKIFKGLKNRELDNNALEEALAKRGIMNRIFGKFFKVVNSPWQMFPVGVVFGAGFDTTTEVVIIGIAVGIATTAVGVPLWAILILPVLFGAGICVIDTSDAISMRLAYGWAFLNPIRKVYYNLTITVISVLVAFAVGGVEMLQVVSGEFNLSGPFWDFFNNLDFESMGYVIISTFVGAWVFSMWWYKHKKYETEYAAPERLPESPTIPSI